MQDSRLTLARSDALLNGRRRLVPPGLVRFIRRKPLGAASGAVIILLLVVALTAPWLAPHPYDVLNVPNRLEGPSMEHLAGTDTQGRDQFSRIIYGATSSVIVAFGAVAVAGVLSTMLGIISGYKAGLFDTVFQRFVDIWLAFPGLIFIIFLVAIFGAGRATLVIVIGLLYAAGMSRLIRSAAIAVSAEQFIEAAQAMGARDPRIWLRHILPNVVPVVIVSVSVQIGAAIITESSLSFLGYGVPPPFPSWGRMLNDAQPYVTRAPYLAVFPGLAIAITVFAFNMFGDALRDVLDPRLRGSR